MIADPAHPGEQGVEPSSATGAEAAESGAPVADRVAAPRQTLNGAVRRRRADRAFYIRLAGAIRQNERALERLKR